MSERYRLVFRGEVLDGQHKAVVKQRLGAALKVEGERLDALFTGKAVTIRKDADTDTAARFQIVFKRAGARLRVVPVAGQPESESEAAQVAATPADSGGFRLAPAGSLMADPRPDAPIPPVNISHLTLAAPGAVLGVPNSVAAVAPDVSHLTIAVPGADLGVPAPAVPAPRAPAWDVAAVGADLAPPAAPVDPPFELDAIEFELAPAGALLVDADDGEAPPPPDTSHLSLL